ncbi:hypothetical protein GXM_07152 [Nostoc sphaeroides CCNUC1]|uniref:Uncharacterized protein n=1 Tax=Nostoc sphaeroides CCNUC1 TaxID=2653204 RepID=A0A5P8WA64_9NOSO|nr:hypothetical protein GXM_07152 [Nostoc sphaeroides CCNUC1]
MALVETKERIQIATITPFSSQTLAVRKSDSNISSSETEEIIPANI